MTLAHANPESAGSEPDLPVALRQWLREQAQAGYSREVVQHSLLQAGWQAALVQQALRSEWDEPLPSQAAQMPAAPQRLPALSHHGHATRLDLGDRQVAVVARLSRPTVAVLGDLLGADECAALIAAARPRLARSLTVDTQTGGEALNPDRTSQGMFFRRGESPLIARIEARIARLLNWPVDHGEGLQVLRYGVGAEYKPHYDYFDPVHPGSASVLRRGGQRVATLVMYLNQPEQGGATVFPDAGLAVSPVPGHAVFFSYDRPHPSTATLHGGAPVLQGEKWVATKWLREQVFE